MSFRSNRLLRCLRVGVTANDCPAAPHRASTARQKQARGAPIRSSARAPAAHPWTGSVLQLEGPRLARAAARPTWPFAVFVAAPRNWLALFEIRSGSRGKACLGVWRRCRVAPAIGSWCRSAAMLPCRPKRFLSGGIPLRWLVRLAINLIGLTATAAVAQPYPDRPVKVVVGFAAGGPTDVIARMVCDKFSTRFGKQFYVVNQPGAGSNTATGMVATSPRTGIPCSSSARASSSTRACSPRSPTIRSRISPPSASSRCRPTS
jgi:hypothetical protein